MPGEFESRVRRHFENRPRESLVRGLLDADDNLPFEEGLMSPSRAVRRLTAVRLKRVWGTGEILNEVLRGLTGTSLLRKRWLEVLSFFTPRDTPQLAMEIAKNLSHSDAEVRRFASRAICRRYPGQIHEVLSALERFEDFPIAEELCLSGCEEAMDPLLGYFDRQQMPYPPSLGFLLTPELLAKNYPSQPDVYERLIVKYGYGESPISSTTLEHLAQGFWFTSHRMQCHPQMECLQKRIADYRWMLLPDSLGLSSEPREWLNPDDDLECDLFLAAVRESDRDNLRAWTSRSPYVEHPKRHQQIVTCMHAPTRYCRTLFFKEGNKPAEELKVPSSHLGQFLTERTRVLLETDAFQQVEADAILRTRWSLIGQGKVKSTSEIGPIHWPVEKDSDFPSAKFAVLNTVPTLSEDRRLSPGARSITNLAASLGESTIATTLEKLEQTYARFLVPMGIELQVPCVDAHVNLGWRQALRFSDVPSPRRPENLWMVEAAFRPAISFHASILGPLLLCRLGLIREPQDMGLHFSVQGDVGERVRSIVFPQLFMHLPRYRKHVPLARISRVMSKGLVNLNHDVECCRPDSPPVCRTELRVFAVIAEASHGGVKLNPAFTEDLVSIQLIASGMMSAEPGIQKIVQDYETELDDFVRTLPDALQRLYESNFYESTGDPEDMFLLEQLPVVQKRRDARKVSHEEGLGSMLESRFEELMNRYAGALHREFLELYPPQIDLAQFPQLSNGVPIYLPFGLEEFLQS